MKTLPPAFIFLAVAASTLLGNASGGFLFVTFDGAKTPDSEQVYFALSSDGSHWTALNDSRPVLVSNVGEQGVRDPYLLRSADGKSFYLLATDLSMNRNPDWRRAIRAGSPSIVIWESRDLVTWSEPRLVRVAPEGAGCSWAPEAIYDEEAGDYLVFWASTTKDDDFARHRIWASRTPDFRTFSKPFIFIDGPAPTIDTTIVKEGRMFYRFTKDEHYKAVTMQKAERLAGPWSDVPAFSLAGMEGFEGPQCYLIEPARGEQPPVWGLILDHFAKGRGYQPFVTRNLASGHFEPARPFSSPFKFRHGSVLALSPEEFARLSPSSEMAPGFGADKQGATADAAFPRRSRLPAFAKGSTR